MNYRHLFWVLICLFVKSKNFAQNFTADFIKTVQIQNTKNDENSLLFKLNEGFVFSFDDLEADQKNYTYYIQHCEKNWEASDLNTSQFLKGYDSFEINNFENSFNTLQAYTNYKFTIPNKNTSIKISGNFLITIFNEDDEICIQRRIVIYEPLITIAAKVIRDRDLQNITKTKLFNSRYTTQISISILQSKI